MHSKSDNAEFMIYDNADEVIDGLFQLMHYRYQLGLETSMRASEFIFGCVSLLYYNCHKMLIKQQNTSSQINNN